MTKKECRWRAVFADESKRLIFYEVSRLLDSMKASRKGIVALPNERNLSGEQFVDLLE
jgi:hypothetical protein